MVAHLKGARGDRHHVVRNRPGVGPGGVGRRGVRGGVARSGPGVTGSTSSVARSGSGVGRPGPAIGSGPTAAAVRSTCAPAGVRRAGRDGIYAAAGKEGRKEQQDRQALSPEGSLCTGADGGQESHNGPLFFVRRHPGFERWISLKQQIPPVEQLKWVETSAPPPAVQSAVALQV